jgi:LacI family transcriptional regulator
LCNRTELQPFNALLLNGILEICESSGFSVSIAKIQYSPGIALAERDLPLLVQSRGADSLIVLGTNYPNLLAYLEGSGWHYVYAGNSFFADQPAEPINCVYFDHRRGGRQAASYLIELGHRDIWYIGDRSLPWYSERYQGYLDAMEQAGLTPRGQIGGFSDDRFLNGFHTAEMLLDQRQPVTAIIGGTNEVAYGVWEALDRKGLQVPKDMSLIAFDDHGRIQGGRPMTTIRVDPEEEGRELARMAIRKIETGAWRLPEVILSPTLVKTGTCNPILTPATQAEIISDHGAA